ncbi:hypothetical protein [Neochlamydia sp. AcF95]|nr:hypothetical protein [Neochlamydia sp. AcF95]
MTFLRYEKMPAGDSVFIRTGLFFSRIINNLHLPCFGIDDPLAF